VKDLMRYEITLRGVHTALSEIPRRWMSELLKLRWFRASALSGGPPTREVGVCRDLATEQGPPPDSRVYSFVTKAAAQLSLERVEDWRGVKVIPYRCTIDRRAFCLQKRLRSPRMSNLFFREGWQWRFSWPKVLLSFFRENYPTLLRPNCTTLWMDDHPFLCRRRIFSEVQRTPPWRNPAFASAFISDWPLGYS
jgi:hypothetical protein